MSSPAPRQPPAPASTPATFRLDSHSHLSKPGKGGQCYVCGIRLEPGEQIYFQRPYGAWCEEHGPHPELPACITCGQAPAAFGGVQCLSCYLNRTREARRSW